MKNFVIEMKFCDERMNILSNTLVDLGI